MSDAQRFQMVVAEVQAARQQAAALNAQLKEIESSLKAIDEQPENLALHRQIGGILVEVKDRDSLKKELEENLETLSAHSARMQDHEKELMATYELLKKSLEGSN